MSNPSAAKYSEHYPWAMDLFIGDVHCSEMGRLVMFCATNNFRIKFYKIILVAKIFGKTYRKYSW